MLKNCIEQARVDENCIGNINFEDEVLIDFDISGLEFEKIQFVKCTFERCDFSGSSFYHVIFVNCDFSNCIFTETFWKQSNIADCLIDGIIVSDNLNELRGAKINAAQAVSIVQILGIEIIRQ
jgi:uncharacterized protein YjbI with pentapeptide repeats